jgi:amidohydrolase
MESHDIRALAAKVAPDVTAWRRHLHQNPELSFHEVETAAFVAARLTEMGYAPRTGLGGVHSVVAELVGGRPGPTIALRADMDALPIHEETNLPFASTRPGKMHACGHDAHTSVLLGAAKVLHQIQDQLPGKIVFLFQPAEELPPGGAKPMVEAGVLDGVDAVFGLHVSNPVPTGQIGFRSGPVNAAADLFKVTLFGQGGHAAYPHNTVDPMIMLAAAISGVQAIISRSVNPVDSAVLTIGWVRGGDADNIIPEKVEFGGTIRTFDPQVQALVHARLKTVIEGVAASFGGRAEVVSTYGYPVLHNDVAMTEVARQAAALVLGEENTMEPLLGLGGEDFAYYAQARPAFFARLGTGTPQTAGIPAHNPRFVIAEESFEVGVAYYVALALHAADLMSR